MTPAMVASLVEQASESTSRALGLAEEKPPRYAEASEAFEFAALASRGASQARSAQLNAPVE